MKQKKVMPHRRKEVEVGKCPKCKRESLRITKIYRINYPFGHNSYPAFTLIRRIEQCGNDRCKHYDSWRKMG